MSDKLQPRLSFKTMEVVAAIICGNPAVGQEEPLSPYRTQSQLSEFFREDLGISPPPGLGGSSRATEAKSWLKSVNETHDLARIVEAAVRPGDYQGTEYEVRAVVDYLNEYLKHDRLRLVESGNRWALMSGRIVSLPSATTSRDILSDEYLLEMESKCDSRLAQGDLEGAVTAARTLLEVTLKEIESRITGQSGNYKGDLPKQFKAVSKLLKMDADRPDLDARFKDVVRGLVMLVGGLAPLRNRISDGHARTKAPAPHHARVVVNAAKTVAGFLLESFQFQEARRPLRADK
ncbi:MAG: abortive infection family protein [Bacteroidota bacterium]